jgi:transcriptional regulator with XRE-family HTH domain
MQTTHRQTVVGDCELFDVPRDDRKPPSADVAARLGENLRRERRRAGLSQDELAQRADLHRTAVGLLERGGRVARADTLIQLAGAMSISPAAFFEGIYWIPNARSKGGAFSFGSESRRSGEAVED